MYKVFVTQRARREVKELSKVYREPVLSALCDIEEDPLIGKPLNRELTGKLSYRIGVYRIIYLIHHQNKTVTILTFGHRATVYGK